jgi:hypothetical protein
VCRRVAGNLSSTRAELAAIAKVVKLAPIETDLVILINSAEAIRRLTWFRRKDIRPHPRRTKDYDIVQEVVLSLDERGRYGASTTMVKVHRHTGERLHATADDQGSTPRSLIACFAVVVATASPEPEERYERLVSCDYQRARSAVSRGGHPCGIGPPTEGTPGLLKRINPYARGWDFRTRWRAIVVSHSTCPHYPPPHTRTSLY